MHTILCNNQLSWLLGYQTEHPNHSIYEQSNRCLIKSDLNLRLVLSHIKGGLYDVKQYTPKLTYVCNNRSYTRKLGYEHIVHTYVGLYTLGSVE